MDWQEREEPSEMGSEQARTSMTKTWISFSIVVCLSLMLATPALADVLAGKEAFTLYLDGNAVDLELGVKPGANRE